MPISSTLLTSISIDFHQKLLIVSAMLALFAACEHICLLTVVHHHESHELEPASEVGASSQMGCRRSLLLWHSEVGMSHMGEAVHPSDKCPVTFGGTHSSMSTTIDGEPPIVSWTWGSSSRKLKVVDDLNQPILIGRCLQRKTHH